MDRGIVIQLEKRYKIAEQKFCLSRRRIEEHFCIPIDDNTDRRNFCREDGLFFKLKDYNIEYSLKRSRRRTVAIQIKNDGSVAVFAPLWLSKKEIENFIAKKRDWIDKKRAIVLERPTRELSQKDLNELISAAKERLFDRCQYYAKIMGVEYSSVKITKAASRWGSCSHKNAICLSCRLMLVPQEAQDYVVVHELAHIIHKNHSKQFWAVVESVMPDYKARRKLLNF